MCICKIQLSFLRRVHVLIQFLEQRYVATARFVFKTSYLEAHVYTERMLSYVSTYVIDSSQTKRNSTI